MKYCLTLFFCFLSFSIFASTNVQNSSSKDWRDLQGLKHICTAYSLYFDSKIQIEKKYEGLMYFNLFFTKYDMNSPDNDGRCRFLLEMISIINKNNEFNELPRIKELLNKANDLFYFKN